VRAALPETGVTAPVTAVLLNLRAYDTLLELVVILLAVIAAWAQRVPPRVAAAALSGRVLLASVLRVLVPVMVLVGGYLLWRGTHGPGGAFQAGAVLAGAAVLVVLAGEALPVRWGRAPQRVALAAGVLAFTAIGLVTARGQGFLHYRGTPATWAIVAIELAATVAIAVALTALVVARTPAPDGEDVA
jgi:multisubunit Na+/H+ antiporter MnhB subunit